MSRNCICPSHFSLLSRQTPMKLKMSTFSYGILFMTSLGSWYLSVLDEISWIKFWLDKVIICLPLTSHRFFPIHYSLNHQCLKFQLEVYSIVLNIFVSSANRIDLKTTWTRYVIHIDKKKWSQSGTLWYTSSEIAFKWLHIINFDIHGVVE